jgi:hypothetical protein
MLVTKKLSVHNIEKNTNKLDGINTATRPVGRGADRHMHGHGASRGGQTISQQYLLSSFVLLKHNLYMLIKNCI